MANFDEFAIQSNQIITFTSAVTGKQVSFPAFLTNFSDDYSVGWSGETLFGRVDPIKHYQSTSRRISAAFDVLAKDENTALKNFFNFSTLVQMLYPVYSDPVGQNVKSRTIRAAPLMRIKYTNYIRSEANPHGLLGCIGGFNFSPKFDAGHILTQDKEMVPLVYNLSFVFEPLHEVPLGYNQSGQFLSGKFPYNQGVPAADARQPASDPTGE